MNQAFQIQAQNLGKRYRREWIFKTLNHSWQGPQRYGIRGRNGAGKSTLLQILSGYLSPSQGSVQIQTPKQILQRETWHQYLAIVAPYTELIEEFTLLEHLQFQAKFKPWLPQLQLNDVLHILDFPKSTQHRPLNQFSSGMKQRVKLALALSSSSPILLLDEPTITLDRQGIDWYAQLIQTLSPQRLCLIASNVEEDYQNPSQILEIGDYKN